MLDIGDGSAGLPWVAPVPGGIGALAAWTAAHGDARLASSGTDGTVQIWDPQLGEPIGEPLVGHSGNVLRLAVWTWSGGRLLVSASEDGTARVWNLDADPPAGPVLAGHDGWVQALAFWTDPGDVPRLATGGTDGTVRIWDPRTGDQLGPRLVPGGPGVTALTAWSTPQGVHLAVADSAGDIRIWDVARRRRVERGPIRHRGGAWALLAWTAADGTHRLASGGQDGTIQILDPMTGEQVVRSLRGHTNWVPTLATWTEPDGARRLVSASTDGTIRLWDGDTGTSVGSPLSGFSSALAALALWYARDGRRRLAIVGSDGAIRSVDLDTRAAVGLPLVGHVAGTWALTSWHEADGTRLAIGGDDGTIRIWNADTGQPAGEPLTGHTAAVWALVTWRAADGSTLLASTGDDATVRVWNLGDRVQTGEPMSGHIGWIPGLAAWRRADGSTALVSAGTDGTVRRWDPASGTAIGEPMPGHDGAVMTVVAWQGRDGTRLASAGIDGIVRIWDADSGDPVGPPLVGHTGWVRSLAVWQDASRTLLVSAGYDGTIRVWDAATGSPVGEPLTGHVGRVAAVTTWTTADGRARLASAGADTVIRRWDLDRGQPIEPPLAGHASGVWVLASWQDPTAGVRLASAGHDGSVRLWDPERGRAIRTIEIGPVAMWGVSDAPTVRDVVGRQVLADGIADQIRRPASEGGGWSGGGPTVVSVEGPWGCGKTTLMNLVRERLAAGAPDGSGTGPSTRSRGDRPAPLRGRRRGRRLTVRAVLRAISAYPGAPARPDLPPAGAPEGKLTAWFSPWAYQSGEQVWAGLANEIIEVAADVLYPTDADRQRYWLTRNLSRVDRFALRRSLLQRTRSPILGLAVAALIATVVVSIAGLGREVEVAGVVATPITLAVVVAVATIIAGMAHTWWRRWFGLAVAYLSTDLLYGAVVEGTGAGADDPAGADVDPLRRARTGALYLHQHNIGDLIDDLARVGYGLVVFVDDIDRCRPGTVAEVFEAINLFLSNVTSRSGLRAQFVVGLDSAVVASHLDRVYGDSQGSRLVMPTDDPTPGWSFLRKLIQLPILVPVVPDAAVHRLVDSLTDAQSQAVPVIVPTGGAGPGGATPPVEPAPARPQAPVAGPRPHRSAGSRIPAPRVPVDTLTWRSTEHHPQVRELLVQRLSAQPYRSIRESKRLINVWQFYARIMDTVEPLARPDHMIVRARRLLILAEIVTRWPALQGHLHRHVDQRRGLQLLASATGTDREWRKAVTRLELRPVVGPQSLSGLRSLLREHDGPAVADLAAQLM